MSLMSAHFWRKLPELQEATFPLKMNNASTDGVHIMVSKLSYSLAAASLKRGIPPLIPFDFLPLNMYGHVRAGEEGNPPAPTPSAGT